VFEPGSEDIQVCFIIIQRAAGEEGLTHAERFLFLTSSDPLRAKVGRVCESIDANADPTIVRLLVWKYKGTRFLFL